MYKLIIVDDELGSAKAMSKFIDYEEFNFTVEGVLSSAEQALKFICENDVDLVISDIKMQGMDGIELLKTVNEKFPRIKVILVSAYRDFEYAKEAISNDAFDYITKPISYVGFTNTLEKVKKSFEQRGNVAISNVDLATEIQGKFLDYFNNNIDISELALQLKSYVPNEDITNNHCSIININIPDIISFLATKWKHGNKNFFHALKQIIPINMNEIIFSVLPRENNDIRVIAVDVNSSKEFKKRIDEFISHINYEIFMVFGLNVDITVTNTANSLSELKNNCVNSTIQMFNLCMFHINRKEMNQTDKLIDKFFKIKKLDDCREFCNLLTHETAKRGIIEKEIIIDEVGIKCIDNSEILKEYTFMLLNSFGEKISNSKDGNLLRIISHISLRYADDISLESVAKITGLTSSYISHYFKQKMNVSFSDFIIKVRMENAKRLLINEPDLTISNIVIMVGYESQPYFYKAFRKYEGCLPSEYRSKGLLL